MGLNENMPQKKKKKRQYILQDTKRIGVLRWQPNEFRIVAPKERWFLLTSN